MRGIRGLIVGVFLGLCSVASGQDGSLFLEQWEEAKTIQGLPDGIYLELVFKTSPDNIQVGPGEKVPDAEQRIRLWWESDGLWRLAWDKPGFQNIEYHDAAWSSASNAAWSMNAGSLRVVDPGRIPDRQNPSAAISSLPLTWAYMATGVAAHSPLNFKPESADLRADGKWTAKARSANGERTTTYEGVVAPDDDRLLTEWTHTSFSGQSPATLAGSSRLGGWRREPLSPTGWLATEYTQFGPDDEFVQSFRVVAVRSLRDDDHVGELARIPTSDANDPVRGKVTFRSIIDHRPGKQTVTMSGMSAPVPDQGQSEGVSVTRVMGWLALAGLVFGLIYVRWKSKSI